MQPKIVFDGKKANGLSEISARIEANKRNRARPEYDWSIETYLSHEEMFPHHPITRYRVVGVLKEVLSK